VHPPPDEIAVAVAFIVALIRIIVAVVGPIEPEAYSTKSMMMKGAAAEMGSAT
jgi:hypothetical protein